MTGRRIALGVLTLCALAAAPAAAAPQSPACALLNGNEAILAVNGSPVVSDGGPAQSGYSDCAWSNTGGAAVMSLLVWSPDFFAAGKETAQARFAKLVAALRLRHLPASAVAKLGEQALLVDESSAGLAAYTLVILGDGAVVEIAGRGVTRAATLAAAEAVMARMTGAVAAVGPAVSPACKLIAAADLPGADFSVTDGGPAANGESVCSWQNAASNADVSLILRAHKPSADPANTDVDFYTALPDPEPGTAPDPLDGVGEKANMQASGDDPNASYTITLLMRGQLAVLSTFRVERAGAVKLATTVAGRIR